MHSFIPILKEARADGLVRIGAEASVPHLAVVQIVEYRLAREHLLERLQRTERVLVIEYALLLLNTHHMVKNELPINQHICICIFSYIYSLDQSWAIRGAERARALRRPYSPTTRAPPPPTPIRYHTSLLFTIRYMNYVLHLSTSYIHDLWSSPRRRHVCRSACLCWSRCPACRAVWTPRRAARGPASSRCLRRLCSPFFSIQHN